MPNRGRFYNLSKKFAAVISIVVIVFVFGHFSPIKQASATGIDIITTTPATGGVGTNEAVTIAIDWDGSTPSALLSNGDTFEIWIGEPLSGDEWQIGSVTTSNISCDDDGTGESYTVDTITAAGGEPMKVDVTATTVGTSAGITTCVIGDGTDPSNPITADIYGVQVSFSSGDSGAGVVYIGDANDVDVSVTVLPNLSMLLDSPDTTYCTTSGVVITCDLGVVTTAALAEGDYDIQVGTNAATGATISIAEDGDLGTIDDITNDATVTAGVEDYGLEITETGVWAMQGNYVANDTPIESGPTAFAQYTSPILESGDDINIKHQVGISSITAAGSHSHTVTYTVAGNF